MSVRNDENILRGRCAVRETVGLSVGSGEAVCEWCSYHGQTAEDSDLRERGRASNNGDILHGRFNR